MNRLPADILAKARALRVKCYRHMFLLDGETGDSMEMFRQTLSWVSATCKELLLYHSREATEEAELCLSVLVGYNVTIRHDGNIRSAVERAVLLLPSLPDEAHLKAHLLVYLYDETGDITYADEAHELMAAWPSDSLTQEDRWVQESFRNIESAAVMPYYGL